MAGELKVTLQATLTKSNLKGSWNNGQQSIDVATTGDFAPSLSIGTSEEAVTFTDVSSLGWLFMKNLDTTNYVDWGPESGGAMVAIGRMKAGEEAAFRCKPGITLRLQANTAACRVKFWMIEA